jgi:hypothetical protein
MAVRFAYEGDVVVFAPEGVYPPDELFEAWEAAFADERCPDAPVVLLDIRRSGSVAKRSRADLRRITDFFLRHAARPDRRVALLTRGPLQYGIMRIARTWVSLGGATAAVFSDRSKAMRWLHAAPGWRGEQPAPQ